MTSLAIISRTTYFWGMENMSPLPADLTDADAAMATEALLCFNLYAASHAFIRLYTPYLDRLGLTYPQFLVLMALHSRDAQQVGELGATLAMETNTLSPLLKRMTAAGLVQRTRSPQDERRVVVALSEQGRAKAALAAEVPSCISRDSGMSHDSYLETLATLRSLRAQIARTAQQQASAAP